MTSQMHLFLKFIQLSVMCINTILVPDLRVDTALEEETKNASSEGKAF